MFSSSILKRLILLLIFYNCFTAFSQVVIHKKTDDLTEFHHNRVGLFIGSGIVPTHLGHHVENDFVFVPAYGLELGHSFNRWFGVSIHNEIELQHLVIIDENNNQINRNNIYILSILVYLSPVKHLGIFIGPGHEFTGNQHYSVYKLGLEYSFHIAHGWDLAPEICYDNVGDIYHTFTYGITIGKSFNFKPH